MCKKKTGQFSIRTSRFLKHPIDRAHEFITCTIRRVRQQPFLSLCVTLAVIMLAPYVVFFVTSMWREPTLLHLKQLLYLWQTQVAGIFAVLAALIGAAAVHWQTTNALRIEEEKRSARALSLRASMAPVLDAALEFARNSALWLQIWRVFRDRVAAEPVRSLIEKPGPQPKLSGHSPTAVSALIEVSRKRGVEALEARG